MEHGGAHSGHVWLESEFVESHRRLDVNALARQGALVAGARTVWQWADGEKATVLAAHGKIFLIGTRVQEIRFGSIALTLTNGGTRARLFCSTCNRGCYHLHDKAGMFACRRCCGYDWRCRHR